MDGRPYGASTGNLSVTYIQHSPIGAAPMNGYTEPPPALTALQQMKHDGLAGYEDYIAWGSVERVKGKWDWSQHDAVERRLHAAGLRYIVYPWLMVTPVWAQDGKHVTLMKCAEHGRTTNFVSIWDPRSIAWYDRFYKALHHHFGRKLDATYACILGPYGEGNYPLPYSNWVLDLGHIHEGWWCADDRALQSFRTFARSRYGTVDKINSAWGTSFACLDRVDIPARCRLGGTPTEQELSTPKARAYWLDFMEWYDQSIVDFAARSIRAALRCFRSAMLAAKPGGSAGGVNPISWGTYCPLYAKMAGRLGITLQPADCHGAPFADKWVGTAYRFYHVGLATEPAGGISPRDQVRRMFSDACCGARAFFTYNWETHRDAIRRYLHLYTGQSSTPDVAVMYPTTDWLLGRNVWPTVRAADDLRDATDYDVLDELLIRDGALNKRYKALIVFQGRYVDGRALARIRRWEATGGVIVAFPGALMEDPLVAGARLSAVPRMMRLTQSLQDAGAAAKAAAAALAKAGIELADGRFDNVWSAVRDDTTLTLNMHDPNRWTITARRTDETGRSHRTVTSLRRRDGFRGRERNASRGVPRP